MVIKCYDKPNRTEPRRYTDSDLKRIAGYVQRSTGANPWVLVATVAGGLGVGALLCRLADVWQTWTSLFSFLTRAGGLLATATLIRILFTNILRTPLARIPLVTAIALAIIAVMVLIERVLQAMIEAIGDAAFVNEVSEVLNTMCQWLTDSGAVVYEKADDLVGDIKDEFPTLPDLPFRGR